MDNLIKRMVFFLKTHKQFNMIDQTELDEFSWEEANSIVNYIESVGELVGDECDENGFETVTFNLKYDNEILEDETTYGIGSFTILRLK